MLHLRSCATTPLGLWSQLDERLGSRHQRGGATTTAKPIATLLPHPVLMERFRSKVVALRQSLDDASIRTEAAAVLSTLIESVTIYPDEASGPEAEVVGKVSNLLT